MTRPWTFRQPDGTVQRSKVVTRTPCGKYGYSSRKLAKQAAANSRRMTGEPIYAYHCPHGCHSWHIGHRIGQGPRVRRLRP